jgi:hypothetical protein
MATGQTLLSLSFSMQQIVYSNKEISIEKQSGFPKIKWLNAFLVDN